MNGNAAIALTVAIFIALIILVYFVSYIIGILIASLHPKREAGHNLHHELAQLAVQLDHHRQQTKRAEQLISQALHNLSLHHPYVVFDHFSLNSLSGHPQAGHIDHVVVAQTGIFCIETKPHNGSIRTTNGQAWEHHHDGKRSILSNPLQQSEDYRQALATVLGPALRGPIHYYVVFPRAHMVQTPHVTVTNNIDDVIRTIERHQKAVYSAAQFERILKLFIYASHPHTSLTPEHRRELVRHLQPKAKEIRH